MVASWGPSFLSPDQPLNGESRHAVCPSTNFASASGQEYVNPALQVPSFPCQVTDF